MIVQDVGGGHAANPQVIPEFPATPEGHYLSGWSWLDESTVRVTFEEIPPPPPEPEAPPEEPVPEPDPVP